MAKELITKLSAQDYSVVEARLDKTLQTPETRNKLEEIARLIPAGEPKSIHTIGVRTNKNGEITTCSLTFEYEYDDAWLVANVVMRRSDSDDVVTVTGINISPHKQSLETENAFTFSGKSWFHYIVFCLALLIPSFIIYAIVVCVRTKIAKRKWLWLLFIAVGFFQLHLNWTTGAWSIQTFSFLLLGAGFMKAASATPLILSVAFPLGAVLFLAKRQSLENYAIKQAAVDELQ
jgi:hypothetical protein